ncbi:MAG: hypothetical protein CMK32_09565 [Porticoccaceae bacterium]|nr:hypothetical protein [Porticoccaceae bacterium]
MANAASKVSFLQPKGKAVQLRQIKCLRRHKPPTLNAIKHYLYCNPDGRDVVNGRRCVKYVKTRLLYATITQGWLTDAHFLMRIPETGSLQAKLDAIVAEICSGKNKLKETLPDPAECPSVPLNGIMPKFRPNSDFELVPSETGVTDLPEPDVSTRYGRTGHLRTILPHSSEPHKHYRFDANLWRFMQMHWPQAELSVWDNGAGHYLTAWVNDDLVGLTMGV